MNDILGFHISIVSSENIPYGCYSIEISYGNQTANLGHMKKNCQAHLGWYFPLTSTQLMTLSFSSVCIQLYRGNHSYSKTQPFGSCSHTISSIKATKSDEIFKIPVSITDSAFSSVTCSLDVKIQIIYKSSILSLPEPNVPHKPIALKLHIKRGEFVDASWDSKFYCALVFPSRDRISTSAVVGVNPEWNYSVILNDPSFLQTLAFTCEVYRKTELMDEYMGSAECAYSYNGQDGGDMINLTISIGDKKSLVATLHLALQYVYCCTASSHTVIEKEIVSPTQSILSGRPSIDGQLSIASSRKLPSEQKSTTKFRFVKMHESFI